MNRAHAFITLAFVAAIAATGTARAEPPASFAACMACHSGAEGALGPSLPGLMGRKAGSDPNFRYSPAMKRSKVVWSDATLDAYLTDPQAVVPGNAMAFPGVADAQQRAEIVKYIQGLR